MSGNHERSQQPTKRLTPPTWRLAPVRACSAIVEATRRKQNHMQAQNTNTKPARQDLLDALALWKVAAAAGGESNKNLEAAAEAAWPAYSDVCNRAAQEGVQP